MRRPTKIKVAAFDIEVVDFPPFEAAALNRFGQFTYTSLTIKIDHTIHRIKYVDTLLHELNHVIYWAYGMEDEDKEERIVGTYATAWTQVFRDNPDLLEFIKHNLKEEK